MKNGHAAHSCFNVPLPKQIFFLKLGGNHKKKISVKIMDFWFATNKFYNASHIELIIIAKTRFWGAHNPQFGDVSLLKVGLCERCRFPKKI